MKQIIFQQLKNELINGGSKKGHSFRFFSLASIDLENKPQQRTVVLRKVSEELELYFYTDRRSQKVDQLIANPATSALFYHPEKLIQIKVEGKAEIVTDVKIITALWSGTPLKSRKDYTTRHAPGSLIQHPSEVDFLNEENHFCLVKIIPKQIEYLQLKVPNHIRLLFKKENDSWEGTFLTP